MFWYRQCMGSVESLRRTNSAESRTIKKLMMLSQTLSSTKPSSISLAWDSHASDLKWLGLVFDRTVLSRASFSREASSILRLKKPLPFASLSKVWDSTTQKIVSGPEAHRVVQHEASLRHPCAPYPLAASWVTENTGVPLATPAPGAQSVIARARRMHINRVSEGAIFSV